MPTWCKRRTDTSNYITELSVTRQGCDPTVGEEKGSPALLWWIRPLVPLSAATNPEVLK